MAAYRIKLSDGTTTIDIFGGSDTKVREGGLSMPPPKVIASFISSPYSNGARLASATYDNRIIKITCRIWGSTLADLKTNIRSIHRLLNDAEQRTLLGYGAQVYLEYQWGDTNDQSTFFDILRGDLIMPNNYLSVLLSNSFYVTDAVLQLVCSPLGRYTNQDYAQQTIENDDYATDSHYNYFDITTSEAYGDAPAKLYIKIAQNAAAGSKKIWIAKRSGARYDDDLFIQGEDEDAFTNVDGGATINNVTNADVVDAAFSGGKYNRTRNDGTGQAGINALIGRLDYDMATPPRGQFRVLIYCRVDHHTPGDFAFMKWGFGWSYGDKTYEPTVARGELYSCDADDTLQILDLGVLNIPPIAESDIATNSTFQLRLFTYIAAAGGTLGGNSDWEVDYIFLLPIDEGVVIVNDVAAADALAIDSITDPNNVFIISTGGVIENYPDYIGKPFTLGRETTRIYFLRDDDKDMTFTVDAKYQPLFLVI